MTEVIDQIQQIPGSAGNHSGHHDLEQADQPMLGADSTDTSRVTTATHSRNCSEGIKPPYIQGNGGNIKDFSRMAPKPIKSAGLEPVLSHTEKSCTVSYYRQFLQIFCLFSGSSEAREKLIEDLSSRLSQKLTSQFQYNNIKVELFLPSYYRQLSKDSKINSG